MDIGGHRFFSKVDWVMDWWREMLPIPPAMAGFHPASDPSANLAAADLLATQAPDNSLLIRPRLSRILYLRKFFDYPISLSASTISNLGFVRMLHIGASYVFARIRPIRPEKNLEDFFINRFGKRLYLTFFKSYTEKVWGVKCAEISPEWGAQRIKGLSITKAIFHAVRKVVAQSGSDIRQKDTETSLIEKFLYPKFGPGQMWEVVAEKIAQRGCEIMLSTTIKTITIERGRVCSATCENTRTGECTTFDCSAVVSSMPLSDLVAAIRPVPSADVLAVASGLAYRDFITVGVLLAQLKPNDHVRKGFTNNMYPDTWIYIQENDVQVGRIQIFNNWSPAMVADESRIWLGLEYFCNEGDGLWSLSEDKMKALALAELLKLELADEAGVLDMKVIKVAKAYPAYFGSYDQFPVLREYLDGITNLYPVGRNGMHRYNNQDHSMVSAKLAVECIIDPKRDKSAIWNVNVEQEYHEESKRN